MKFESDYDKWEWYGRQSLLKLQEIYPDLFKYNIELTNNDCIYDAFYHVYDENYKIIKRVFIEVKIRSIDWDKPYLEFKKWKSIKDLIEKTFYLKEGEYDILYINFLPNSTYVWKIKDMDQSNLITSKMNKATMASRSNKVDKKVWELDRSCGKSLDFIFNEKQFIREEKLKDLLEVSNKTIIRGLDHIFDQK
jgi:predicted secreted protein